MIAKVKPFLLSVYVVDDDVCGAAGRDENDGEEARHCERGRIAPSSSIRSKEPVGKNGRMSLKESTKRQGRAQMVESWDNRTSGEVKTVRKVT